MDLGKVQQTSAEVTPNCGEKYGKSPPMPETIQVFFSGIFVENLPRMFDGLLLSMIFLFSPQVAEIEKSSSRWAPPVAPAQVTSPMRRWIDLLGWKT